MLNLEKVSFWKFGTFFNRLFFHRCPVDFQSWPRFFHRKKIKTNFSAITKKRTRMFTVGVKVFFGKTNDS